MATQTVEQHARAIYEMWQATAAKWAKLGALRGAVARQAAATLDEITAHVALCRDLSEQYRVTLDPVALWGEDVRTRALGKARSRAGRRGVAALKNKYGDEFAADLVYSKSGRTIR